jgi:hypothetical protein
MVLSVFCSNHLSPVVLNRLDQCLAGTASTTAPSSTTTSTTLSTVTTKFTSTTSSTKATSSTTSKTTTSSQAASTGWEYLISLYEAHMEPLFSSETDNECAVEIVIRKQDSKLLAPQQLQGTSWEILPFLGTQLLMVIT